MNRRNRKFSRIKNNAIGWLLFLPAIVVFYLAVWRPQAVGFAWSFFKLNGYSVSEFVGFKNYISVISNSNFLMWVKNTFQYVFCSLLIGYLPPFLIAVFLNELMHLKKAFRVIMYLPVIIPGIAGMMIWRFIYSPEASGLLNTFLATFGIAPQQWLQNSSWTIMLIMIYSTWKGFGGSMILYYAALQGIDRSLYEVATLEGATPLQKMWHITIPQVAGTLVLCLINQIISVFQIMEQPLAMTGGGPNGASTSLGYKMYEYGFVSQGTVGQALAIGGIMFVFLMGLNFVYIKANKKFEENI